MSKKYNVAVVGATGAVGKTMLRILEQRKFPVDNLYLLASERSAGETMTFNNKEYVVENLADFDFSKAQIGLFSPGASVSAVYAVRNSPRRCNSGTTRSTKVSSERGKCAGRITKPSAASATNHSSRMSAT